MPAVAPRQRLVLAGVTGAALLSASIPLVIRTAQADNRMPVPVKAVKAKVAKPAMDPRVLRLLQDVDAATRKAKTLTADFTYSVTSAKRQQYVAGSVRMRKPNFARVTLSDMSGPAYPNLVASDGQKVYTFMSAAFVPNTRTFRPGFPFDRVRDPLLASGLPTPPGEGAPGGGTIATEPAAPNGSNIHLWDAVPVQAFFGPAQAITRWVYVRNLADLRYDGIQKINGVRYRVLRHHFKPGQIAGGEKSQFEQRLYIGDDNLIHRYVLEFTSAGRPSVEVVTLSNIRVNAPLSPSEFAFAPPRNRTATR